jgi:hypothetical protein
MNTARMMLRGLGPASRASRVAMAGAAFWAISALVHTGVYLVDGGGWSGPVSWRKPIVFSVSVGSLMWVMGWVIDRLRSRPRLAGWIAWTFVVSGSIETALIVVQTWRGQASHFNTAAAADAIIFGVMGGMVGIMSISLVALTVWAVVERPASRDVRLAVLAGLAMVVAGLGLGQWIIDLGTRYVEQHGSVPSVVRYGEAGVAKFPHAVAFHGIHLFAVLAVLMRVRNMADGPRRATMRWAVGAYATLLAFAALQTYAGRAPFDIQGVSAVIVGVAVGALVAVFVRTWRHVPTGGAGRPAVEPEAAAAGTVASSG